MRDHVTRKKTTMCNELIVSIEENERAFVFPSSFFIRRREKFFPMSTTSHQLRSKNTQFQWERTLPFCKRSKNIDEKGTYIFHEKPHWKSAFWIHSNNLDIVSTKVLFTKINSSWDISHFGDTILNFRLFFLLLKIQSFQCGYFEELFFQVKWFI